MLMIGVDYIAANVYAMGMDSRLIDHKPSNGEKLTYCSHLKPKVIWETLPIDSATFKTVRMPHVVCDNCDSRLHDLDPVAVHWINKALTDEKEKKNGK